MNNLYTISSKITNIDNFLQLKALSLFLNRDDVKETLGAQGNWNSCNMVVNKLFMADFMKSYHKGIPDLLHDGLKVI